jgi:hypothetical protein
MTRPDPDRPVVPTELVRAIAALDSALEKQPPLDEPLVLWRVWQQDVLDLPDGPLEPGDTLEAPGFCDCTLHQGHAMSVAGSGSALVRLLLPPGVRVMPMWHSAGEAVQGLVFLARGTRFRVEAVDEVGGWDFPVVTALVLLPGDPIPEPVGDIALSLPPRDEIAPPVQIRRVVWAADDVLLLR